MGRIPYAESFLGNSTKKTSKGAAKAAKVASVKRVAPSVVKTYTTPSSGSSSTATTSSKAPSAAKKLRKAENRRVKRINQARKLLNKPYPGLDSEQTTVLEKVLKTGTKKGATRQEMLSAVETGLVESGLRNLDYGDADSEGWRQERAQYYSNPTNVKASAKRYFEEARAAGRQETAGDLAQATQQSAYPERYDERKPEAKALLRLYAKKQKAAGNKPFSTAPKKVPLKRLKKNVKFTESKAEVRAEQGAPARTSLTGMNPELQRALVRLSKQTGVPVQINEGYRTAKRANEFPSGTASQHHQGNAADVNNHSAYTAEDLKRAGLTNTAVAGEPWHFQPIVLGTSTSSVSGGSYSSSGGSYSPSSTGTSVPPTGKPKPSEGRKRRGESEAAARRKRLLKEIIAKEPTKAKRAYKSSTGSPTASRQTVNLGL